MAKIYSREIRDVSDELDRAMRKYPRSFQSAHEGFAFICEELDELKEEVWRKQAKHRPKALRKEAIQVAAMALRFAMEVCGK
jgi:NTP pyrophosphatase (non-canonical NTP hydrolase)